MSKCCSSFLVESYRYGFNGQEKDDEIKGSGNHISFSDYGYDPRLGRRWRTDPHFYNYAGISPYAYVNNMPIWAIDPNGKDIIVLSYKKRPFWKNDHRWGHQAMLIGNEKDGWTYYSLDGDSEGNSGVPNDNNFTIQRFENLKDFANSKHNEFRGNYDDPKSEPERDKDGNVRQRYKEAYRITTSKDTDAKMNKVAKEVTGKGHNMVTNNCTNCVESALDAGGLNNGENTKVGEVKIPFMNSKINIFERNYRPQEKQAEIENSNSGTDVDEILVPTD